MALRSQSSETPSFPGDDESERSSPPRTVENIKNVGETEACSQPITHQP